MENKSLAQKDKMLHLYSQGVGVTSIQRITGINKKLVRQILIRAVVYKPNPKHNGIAKKGIGDGSRILRAQKNEKRKQDWRLKIATCLRGLRMGSGIETTCKANGWDASGVWNNVGKRKSYLGFVKRKTSKEASINQYADYAKFGWSSVLYTSEYSFQEHVFGIIKKSGRYVEREVQLTYSRDRVDFCVDKTLFVECKTTTKPNTFARAIGQVAQYKLLEKKNVLIVVPSDVSIRVDQAETVKLLGCMVVNEVQLLDFLSGQQSLPMQSVRTTIRFGFCHCCMLSNKPMSYGPSGDVRSYCKECEPLIKTKAYNFKRRQWLDTPTTPRPVDSFHVKV